MKTTYTHRDKNGNSYTLNIDHSAKTFSIGFGLWWRGDKVHKLRSRKAVREISEELKKIGYKEQKAKEEGGI